MTSKKPVKKPNLIRGCESCTFKDGDFSNDSVDSNITRVYCKARHVSVNVGVMNADCDFFVIDEDYKQDKGELNRYGL